MLSLFNNNSFLMNTMRKQKSCLLFDNQDKYGKIIIQIFFWIKFKTLTITIMSELFVRIFVLTIKIIVYKMVLTFQFPIFLFPCKVFHVLRSIFEKLRQVFPLFLVLPVIFEWNWLLHLLLDQHD